MPQLSKECISLNKKYESILIMRISRCPFFLFALIGSTMGNFPSASAQGTQAFPKPVSQFVKPQLQKREILRTIAESYYLGEQGFPENKQKAIFWFRVLAGLNEPIPMYNLGVCYYSGDGVALRKDSAVYFFRKAAEEELDVAQYNLALCYLAGEGVSQDKDSAVLLFRKAAKQGLDAAQYNLALCYLCGEGVTQNIDSAAYFFRKANKQGTNIPEYYSVLGDLFGTETNPNPKKATLQKKLSRTINRDSIAKQYEGNTSHLHEPLVLRKKSHTPELTPAWVRNAIGESFYLGLPGFPHNLNQAVSWFRQAAVHKYSKAQVNLGVCFFFGDGVTLNKDSAVYWFSQAAEKGDATAQCNLALCYFFGDGLKKDDASVVYWYKQAARRNIPLACNNLGYCYEFGIGTQQDSRLAERYYTLAAEQGFAKAQFNLAAFYYEEETPSALKKANKWLEKAARQGYAPALKALKELNTEKSGFKNASKEKPKRYGLEKEVQAPYKE